MNYAQYTASTGLAAMGALFNGGTLTVYGPSLPTSPETAIDGQVELAVFTFATPAFSEPAFNGDQMLSVALLTTSSANPTAAGTACFARAVAADGTTVLADYLVAAPWQPNAEVSAGQYVVSGGNLYVCTTAGITAASDGPTAPATTYDNTAVWNFVATGNGDINVGSTSVTVGVPLTLNGPADAVPAL